jgi:hypothetical protein
MFELGSDGNSIGHLATGVPVPMAVAGDASRGIDLARMSVLRQADAAGWSRPLFVEPGFDKPTTGATGSQFAVNGAKDTSGDAAAESMGSRDASGVWSAMGGVSRLKTPTGRTATRSGAPSGSSLPGASDSFDGEVSAEALDACFMSWASDLAQLFEVGSAA